MRRYERTHYKGIHLAIALLAVLSGIGCGGARPTGFDLVKDDFDRPDDTLRKEVLLKGTRPFDSIPPEAVLSADVWKKNVNGYPDSIQLHVRVRDSEGYFVTHMADPYFNAGDDYRVLWSKLKENIDTGDVPITDFTVREFGAEDSIPYSIVLSLDHSGSLQGTVDALQEGTQAFIKMKMPYDRLAIVKFDRKSVVEAPMSDDTEFLLKQFKRNGLKGFGLYTNIFDALVSSISLFRNTPDDVPRVLVVFSDGDDNNSSATDSDVFRLAKELEVHIFAVGFGYTSDNVLRTLAEETGGKYYRARSKEDLMAIFVDIYLSLRNFYRVTYTPPEYESLHKVFVTVTPPGRDSVVAETEYDKSPLNPFDTLGKRFSTEKIFFDYNKSNIKPESDPILDNLARILKKYKRIKLEIRGHTDNIGGEAFNLRLSDLRATAVKEALVQRGIDAKRFRTRGFGLSQPIAPNDTEENRAKNRRTEFVIIAR